MAIDYRTPAGQVRLKLADLDPAGQILTDDMIDGFLYGAGENIKRAAADALDAIATSESLLSKAIRTQDLATDGPKVAADLRKHAALLRTEADSVEAAALGDVFEVIPFRPYGKPEGVEMCS